VGHERYTCGIDACTFTASRKDNLQQHHSKYHGLKPTRRPGQRNKPLQPNIAEDRHNLDIAYLRSPSVNCPFDGESWTCAAFLQAATAGNLFILGASLNANMDVNIVGDDQSSALHCASRAGRSSAVQYLLEHGADCEARNNKQRSPLHEALLSQDLETVDVLLQHGAKLNNSHVTLDCLGCCNNIGILKLYLAHFGMNVTQDMLYSILTSASKAGHISTVTGLLSLTNKNVNHLNTTIDEKFEKTTSKTQLKSPHATFSWNPETTHGRSFTPLYFAAAKGHLKVVQLLVDHGFDINSRTGQDLSPLHSAARRGHANVARFLLDQKDIDIKWNGSFGLTPLHGAAKNGNVEIVRLLLDHVDNDTRFKALQSKTALHVAARSGHEEVVQLLLHHPYHNDFRCSTLYGESPLQLAALQDHWEVAKILLDHEEIQEIQGATTTVQQRLYTSPNIMERLLEHPDFCDVNLCDKIDQRTCEGLLHAAIRKDNYDFVNVLLCHEGIDVNLAKGWHRTTALILAAELGRTDAVKLLLQHKNIDIHKRTYMRYRNENALQAARREQHGEIVDLLLAHGAVDHDNTSLSSGNNLAIANSSITDHPQLEHTINHDLGDDPDSSIDEYLDGVFNCVESELELSTTSTTWLDIVLGGDDLT
jgi:ankyrin repeat protein